MSGQQETDLMSVTLSLDLDVAVVKALHQCAETSGRSLDQVVACIVRQHLDICCEEERQPVSVSSLTWDVLVPYARRLKIGTRFNLYDLMIRLHSDKGLSSLKISSAWHSAFAQWVRRNNEFSCERTSKGNMYQRISDKPAPMPKPLDKVPFIDRLTTPELITELKGIARNKPIGQGFTLQELIDSIHPDKLPKRISPAVHRGFRHWQIKTGAFSSMYEQQKEEHQTRMYVRNTDVIERGLK
jgi:hypothetical protein